MNHPAGRIGKRLILRVHDVMLTGSALPLAAPDTLIMEVRLSSCIHSNHCRGTGVFGAWRHTICCYVGIAVSVLAPH